MEGEADTTPAPSKPTFWLSGPPSSSSQGSRGRRSDSFDPECRFVQTYARLNGIEYDVKWLSEPHGAPKSKLPALHLPDGALLAHDEIVEWIDKKKRQEAREKRQGNGEDDTDEADRANEAMSRAYDSLIQSTLMPAVLAALYLVPQNALKLPVVPIVDKPVLSRFAETWLIGKNERARIVDQVRVLKGLSTGKAGASRTRSIVLDLEQVEREGADTIALLESKLADQSKDDKSQWFGKTRRPTALDAWIYALLSIVEQLPVSRDNLMRTQLESSFALVAWVHGNA